MKNRKSIFFIVGLSLLVALMHFIIGPDYNGIFKNFIRGYLIDLILPMNLYLLLQISLRDKVLIVKSRVIGAICTFLFGVIVEILQFLKIQFLGSTYDPLDIVMYGIGVMAGLLIDYTIIDKFENQHG
ncbi:MAG TPA: hypothetical protein PL123_14345 [Bacteroidales bacterium]|nr:hypothetical protein [Bacteroidales bacterium]